MDRAAFYDALRPHLNLTEQNVFGMERVLDYAQARGTPINDLAYILATAWWETSQTMHPVEEAFWVRNRMHGGVGTFAIILGTVAV